MPFFDHFGFIAPFYDRAIRLQNAQKVIEIINLPIEGFMLDAGGGTGRVAQALKGYARKVVVSDLSLGMLRQAQAKNDLELTCAHTECLPFPNETFERVIMVDALHHVCEHRETAMEMWRVLKPGGRIVIEEPDITQFTVKLVALAEKIALMRSHFISAEKISKMFDYRNARINIQRDGFNVWVIVEKI
jgi:ubiquinone/menaquinone biosynthesis C-methylase UbiE